ncbi:MAG: hypothetical protein IMF07_08800, partial [Proteobacteria bacterium]|nr:hypothetical protein [Pseudomonadota bacterium]
SGNIAPLSEKEARRLEISPERVPFYDPVLSFTAEEILKYRNKKILLL